MGSSSCRAPTGECPAVPRLACLADDLVLVIDVADLTDRRAAAHVDESHLTAGHAHLRVRALLGEQLRGGTGAANQLTTAPELDLEVVDRRPEGDVRDGQRAARADFGGPPELMTSPTLNPCGERM